MAEENPLLKQVEAQTEKQLPANIREDYMKIVVSGMRVAMNKGPSGALSTLKQSKDPIGDVVKGAIAIVGMMRKEAQGEMPINALIPAAFTLVIQGLDIAEKLGVITVGNDEIDKATELFVETFLPLLGLSKDKVDKLTEKVYSVVNDPAKLEQLKQAQAAKGQEPAPGAAPTPVVPAAPAPAVPTLPIGGA